MAETDNLTPETLVKPKIGEWKSIKTSRGTKYQTWSGKSWQPTNGTTVKPKTRQYQPDGYNDVYEDHNPFLETESTLADKFGGSGEAIAGAGGSVRYPHDMRISEAEDFVMFDFYDYKPPFQDKKSMNDVGGESYANLTLGDYNATGYSNTYFKDKSYPQILMYMPQDIQDAFSAKWEGKKFGAMTTGILAAAGKEGGVEKIKQGINTLDKAFKKGSVEAAASIVTGLAQKITGDSISAGDLFSSISGVVRNPNVEVLFQNSELRTFDLTFKMAPFDNQDALRIEAIIKIFKMAMLPQYKLSKDTKVFGQSNDALQAGFVQVPKVCAVNFMRGSGRNRFLPRYKMCAITDVNVNYTPDNVYATIDRNMPVATELKLSFMETKLVFSEDVRERGF